MKGDTHSRKAHFARHSWRACSLALLIKKMCEKVASFLYFLLFSKFKILAVPAPGFLQSFIPSTIRSGLSCDIMGVY